MFRVSGSQVCPDDSVLWASASPLPPGHHSLGQGRVKALHPGMLLRVLRHKSVPGAATTLSRPPPQSPDGCAHTSVPPSACQLLSRSPGSVRGLPATLRTNCRPRGSPGGELLLLSCKRKPLRLSSSVHSLVHTRHSAICWVNERTND